MTLDPVRAALFALLAVSLELAALRRPVLGLISPAGAVYLAAALTLGPGPAALLAVTALGLRTLLLGAPSWPQRGRELLADLVPALAAGLGARLGAGLGPWGPPALAFQLYFVAALAAPRVALPETLQARLFPTWLTLAFLGLVLAQSLTVALLAAPALLFVRWALRDVLWREEERQRHALERHLERTQSELEQGRETVTRLRGDLSAQVDDVALLVELSRALSQQLELQDLANRLIDIVFRLMPCRSVAVLVPVEGQLEPLALRSPDRERLESLRLLQHPDVVLEEAVRTLRLADDAGGRQPRLLEAEPARVCLPLLEGQAVLYCGRPEAFRPRELHLLQVVANQGSQAWLAARHVSELRQALEQHARANQRLESWMIGIEQVLGAMRLMTATLERDKVLDELEAGLAQLVPHQSHLIVEEGVVVRRQGVDPEPVGLQDLLDALRSGGLPLMLDDVTSSRFAPLAEGQRSLLAVPMLGEAGPYGAILLGASEPFRRREQDQLFMLAFLATSALQSARLHARALEAYRKLADSEAQLVQSSKLAAVGQLAAGLAHELNTPLASILLSIDAASRYLPDKLELARKRLEAAAQSVLRSQSLVEKLLYYSRDGRSARVPVDLNRVVADALQLIGSQLERDGVRVELDLGAIPRVSGSPQELQQVVTNLLLNARDTLLEGGRQARPIRVTTEGTHDVTLCVIDQGLGVPAEHQASIFDPFYTTKPIGQGTGLGLSVSQQITRAHGGELSFASTPGEGSTFRLRLPGA